MTNELDAVRTTVLSNGLVVITERMPQFRSVSVGIWVRSGSRSEPEWLGGITHFIEHMVFKGTQRRSCEQIARTMDSVGGMLDAFTTKEMVCFSAKVLDEHLPLAFEVIADLVLRPLFAPPDIAKEKQVVLEEIKMDEDNPETLVSETFLQNFWPDHGLGRPILGTPRTVEEFERGRVFDWFHRCYAPNNLVISAAGNVEHDRMVDLVAGEFASLTAGADGYQGAAPQPQSPVVVRQKRELEQAHIFLGAPAFAVADERRFAGAVLNNVLGAGMSSRLFQNIREQQGLAYSVFSEISPYHDTGLLSVYAGTGSDKVERLIGSVLGEFRRLKENAVASEEIIRAKEQLKGSMTLGLESTGARMANRARQHIFFGHSIALCDIFSSIDAVSADQVQYVSRQLFDPEHIALAAVGRLDGFKPTRDLLAC